MEKAQRTSHAMNLNPLSLEVMKRMSGGAANTRDFCIDPLVLKWKLQNPGKELPIFLGGSTVQPPHCPKF